MSNPTRNDVAACGFDNAFLRPTEYLSFERQDNPGRKTGVWIVRSIRSGATLGTIRWYGRWRQYCFWPTSATIFNTDCLVGIADRVSTCNRWQRNVHANRATLERLAV